MKDVRDGVRSVDRALHLLEIIAQEPEGMRLRDLAARASLAPSTCHRLLSALEQRRFVHFSQRSAAWHVGGQAFRVGAAFARRKTFIGPALQMMRSLRDVTRETVNIASPDDGCIVILAQVESREIVRAINVIGGRAPLSSSALGKAVLASYNERALEEHIARHGLPRCTPRTITNRDQLLHDLRASRDRGFAVDCEEHLTGLRCVAAPVFDATGDAVASLSVSGLAGRIDDARIDQIGVAVSRAASALTHEQGGKPPQDWSTHL